MFPSLSLSLDSLALSLDSFHRNRRYPTNVPCCLMAGMQWPVCPYEYHHEMPYLSLLHSTPFHSVYLSSTSFTPSLSPSLSRLCK
jgi:hypothetical protein